MYPSHSAPDSRYSEKTNSPTGGARTILLHVKYISLRLAGFARRCHPQDEGRRRGNIGNCDQSTVEALPSIAFCHPSSENELPPRGKPLPKGPRKNNFTFGCLAPWRCRVPTHRDARRTSSAGTGAA